MSDKNKGDSLHLLIEGAPHQYDQIKSGLADMATVMKMHHDALIKQGISAAMAEEMTLQLHERWASKVMATVGKP